MKSTYAVILLLLIPYLTVAQSFFNLKKDPPRFVKYINLSLEGGPMLGNGTEFGDMVRNRSTYLGLDARLGFRQGSESTYAKVYRFPIFGIGFYTSTFHNADVGEPNALYFFMETPVSPNLNKIWKLNYFFSYGLSYNFNAFDPEENPLNLFIGSNRNAYLHLGFKLSRKLTDRTDIDASLGFKHFSNGASSLPNSGINLIPLSLGASYRLTKDHDKDFSHTQLPQHQRKTVLHMYVAPGVREYFIGDANNLKLASGVHVLREISYKHRLGIGFDHFYSANAESRLSNGISSPFWDSNSFGIFASWEWLLTEHLYAPMGIGAYLHRNSHNDEWNWYYQRAGLRYRFNNNMFAGVSIKAHKGKADFFEWTLGYSIFK